MGYTTLAIARSFIESGFGTCSKSKLTKAVNQIRQHFYNWYQEISLFIDAVECFSVQRFCFDCNSCQDTYLGVTLPRHHQNVEAMWWNDFPVSLKSAWREFQIGISPECDCRLQKFDIPGVFSTAADIAPNRPAHVIVRAVDEADIGKRIVIRGKAATGEPVSFEFGLTAGNQRTGSALKSIDRNAGIVKDITTGRVVVAQEDGQFLSMIEPDETVPSLRRIKITGLPDNCQTLNIRSARRYFPVYGDDDAVETDLEIAWDAMARYLRLFQKSDKAGEDMADITANYALALKIMMGDKARDESRATQAELVIQMPKIDSRGGLSRQRQRGRY